MPNDIRVKLCKGQTKTIRVFGARDPRGYDNAIEIELTEDDELHITVYKMSACYQFSEVIEHVGAVEVIQI